MALNLFFIVIKYSIIRLIRKRGSIYYGKFRSWSYCGNNRYNWYIVICGYSLFVNQRNRKNAALRDIICTERLKTLDNFKRTYFKLYELLKKYSLKKEILNEDFYFELISSSAEFECIIKTFYSIEKEIYNVE